MSTQPQKISILVISGSVGVGKTEVSYALSKTLRDKGITHAVIDLDCLREAFPRPENDPFYWNLGIKNLSAIWKNYEEIGVTHLIIPTVVEEPSEVDSFKSVIPNSDIKVVLLKARLETIHNRLKSRETGDALEWHLKRAVELTNQLEQAKVEDLVIDTDNKTVDEVAKEILVKTEFTSPRG